MFILSSSIFRWLIDLCCFGKRQLAALPSYELSLYLFIYRSLFLSFSLPHSFIYACFKNVCVLHLFSLYFLSLSFILPSFMPFHTFSLLLFFTLSLPLFFFLYTLIIVSKNLSFSLLLALQAFSASAASDSRPIVIDSSLGSTLYRTLHFQRSKMPAESRLVCVCVCVFHVFFLSCASLSLFKLFSPFTFPAVCPTSSQCNSNNKSKIKIKN